MNESAQAKMIRSRLRITAHDNAGMRTHLRRICGNPRSYAGFFNMIFSMFLTDKIRMSRSRFSSPGAESQVSSRRKNREEESPGNT
jgi:hypothetical protein